MRLPENFRKANCRDFPTANEIGKHIPRANRRQLIGVADQNQAAVGRKRAQEREHQLQIDHGRFVDDHRVDFERLVLIVEKRHESCRLVKLRLKQPVDRRGFPSCHLGKALGRAAGRRRQLRFDFHRVKQRQNTGHDGRLARAGATGYDQKLLRGRLADGLAL